MVQDVKEDNESFVQVISVRASLMNERNEACPMCVDFSSHCNTRVRRTGCVGQPER
jgi:hypothetical protein